LARESKISRLLELEANVARSKESPRIGRRIQHANEVVERLYICVCRQLAFLRSSPSKDHWLADLRRRYGLSVDDLRGRLRALLLQRRKIASKPEVQLT